MSPTARAAAAQALFTYTYGMDTGNWRLAASVFKDGAAIDYSAVGGPKGAMTRDALAAFLAGLLGKPGLAVHTAIAQVLDDPAGGGDTIAYYTVRHYRATGSGAPAKFALFGWYRYAMEGGQISALGIHVSATEGEPAVLA